MMALSGKAGIVTGSGGGGCGRATARRLAKEGASVVVSDIDEDGGRETVSLIMQAGGRAAFFKADIRDESQVRMLVDFGVETYGGLDVLVNNASGPGYFPDEPLEYWRATVETDLLGSMYATLCAIDAMRRRGGGAIVNMCSISALPHGGKPEDVGGSPSYNVAKAGLISLTTGLAFL